MSRGKRVVLDSVRLEKRLRELSKEGYKLRQEVVTCNKERHLNSKDIKVLKELGVSREILKYPIMLVEMFFYKERSAKRLMIESDGSLSARFILSDIEYSSEFVCSCEKYTLFVGDEIPEFVDKNKPLREFELCCSEYVLQGILEKYNLLLDNRFLLDVFNEYEYINASKWYTTGKMIGLDRSYASDIHTLLVKNMFTEVEDYKYVSEFGDSCVTLEMNGKISIYYSDRFSDVKNEVAITEIVEDKDFVSTVLHSSKYNTVMLNSDFSNALFNFSDVDLEDILLNLERFGYKLDSLGVVCVRSMVDSVTVCGFKNNKGYLYIMFYYGYREEQFVIRIVSSDEEIESMSVREKVVPLVHVLDGDYTTLIRGFDFSNFRSFALV